MDFVTFLMLLFIAAAAAGVHTLIGGWVSIPGGSAPTTSARATRFVAYAMVLTLPALLPRLLGE